MTFGNRIKEFRKKLNLSQQELAKHLNMQPQALARYEKDKVKPSIELAKKLTDLFNINLNWLLTGKGEMFLNQPKIAGIVNSVIGQVGENEGTINQQNITIGNKNTTTIQNQSNEDKIIQELIQSFNQLPPEMQEYYLHLIKAEAAKYRYEQKKFKEKR